MDYLDNTVKKYNYKLVHNKNNINYRSKYYFYKYHHILFNECCQQNKLIQYKASTVTTFLILSYSSITNY
jgi:hypothetical protein